MKQGSRQTAVLIKNLAGRCVSYSQLCRRMASLGIKWVMNRTKREGRYLAIDGTGIATDYGGDYKISKHRTRQMLYTLHAIVDNYLYHLIHNYIV